jgi:hypothetical protein
MGASIIKFTIVITLDVLDSATNLSTYMGSWMFLIVQPN